MPKELTHCIFADRALAAFARQGEGATAFAALLDRQRGALHLGAVMVDSYFYALHVPGLEKPFAEIGDVIHGATGEDTSRLPLAMLEAARATGDEARREERLAFAAGFLTHVAMDSVLHPFVYNVTGNYYAPDPRAREGAMARHRLLEGWLDLRMLVTVGLDRWNNGFFQRLRALPRLGELRDFYAAATDMALGQTAPAGPVLARGWAIQSLANRLFPITAFVRAVAWLNRCLGRPFDAYVSLCYDWRGGNVPKEIVDFETFRHPVSGERIAGGIDRLFDRAEARAVDYLGAAAAFAAGGSVEDFRRTVTGLSLDFGLVGSKSAEARHFDLIDDARLWPAGEAPTSARPG